MVLSLSHKFIFARGIKTASTSLANELESKIRPLEQSNAYKFFRRIPYLENIYPFYDFRNHPHITLAKAKNILPVSDFNSCLKFGVVREPISWMVSCYKHWQRVYKEESYLKNVNSLEDFVLFFQDHNTPLQLLQFVDSDGSLLSDFVGNFHHMNSFINFLELKLNFDINIQSLNVSPSEQDVKVSSTVKSLIEKVCGLDYEVFDFDSLNNSTIDQNLSFDISTRNKIVEVWNLNGGIQYDPWKLFQP